MLAAEKQTTWGKGNSDSDQAEQKREQTFGWGAWGKGEPRACVCCVGAYGSIAANFALDPLSGGYTTVCTSTWARVLVEAIGRRILAPLFR